MDSNSIQQLLAGASKVIGYISSLGGGSLLIYTLLIGKVTRFMLKMMEALIIVGVAFLILAYWDKIWAFAVPYLQQYGINL